MMDVPFFSYQPGPWQLQKCWPGEERWNWPSWGCQICPKCLQFGWRKLMIKLLCLTMESELRSNPFWNLECVGNLWFHENEDLPGRHIFFLSKFQIIRRKLSVFRVGLADWVSPGGWDAGFPVWPGTGPFEGRPTSCHLGLYPSASDSNWPPFFPHCSWPTTVNDRTEEHVLQTYSNYINHKNHINHDTPGTNYIEPAM